MRRFIFKWLTSLFVILSFGMPLARADETDSDDEGGRPPPAKEYLVAALSTLLIIYTVVKPSRKL